MMIPRWMSTLLTLPLFLALTACPQPQDNLASASDTPAPQAALATIPEDPDPALWVIKDKDTTLYLFGTVHILKPGLTWFDEAVKTAFDASDELVVEMIQPDPGVMMRIVNDMAIDKTGVSLRDKLDPDDRLAYEAALTDLKVPVSAFDPLEPWFASISISLLPLVESGYDTNSGVEPTLTSTAKARNMTITGLETPEQQLGFFDNLPEDVQIRFLNFNIASIGEMADGMENMVAHWANANVSALAELMNAGLEERILYDTLLSNRNANWADWVDKRMEKPGTVFMAVGAGHLAGADSLQAKLKTKGWKAKRIKY